MGNGAIHARKWLRELSEISDQKFLVGDYQIHPLFPLQIAEAADVFTVSSLRRTILDVRLQSNETQLMRRPPLRHLSCLLTGKVCA